MTEPTVCRVRAAVHLRGGPHDGAVTPPVFAVESATETVDIREDTTRDDSRRVRYRHAGSANGGTCVLLIYQFEGYVSEEESDVAQRDTVGREATQEGEDCRGR